MQLLNLVQRTLPQIGRCFNGSTSAAIFSPHLAIALTGNMELLQATFATNLACGWLIAIGLAMLLPCGAVAGDSVTVNIPGQGTVVGNYSATTWSNQRFMQFLGIPYAESPQGNLRFKAPVPRQPWQRPHDATKYGRVCPQKWKYSKLPPAELQGDLEDCLNICVFTKKLNAEQPVMVNIHGGSFYVGFASDYPAGYLLEEDVVLVVPQYRLGALGFYGTGTAEMPGNVGVLDVLLALEWVQKHIGQFGGDPTKVTVFGDSSGAELIGAIMLSPKTPDGLFQRAIAQSGSVLDNWIVTEKPREQVQRSCKALGCGQCENDAQLLQCLNRASVMKLLDATNGERFRPMEADFFGVFPKHPAELIKSYNRAIPLLTGFTKHDGSLVLGWYYDERKKAQPDFSKISVREFATGLMDWYNDTSGMIHNLWTRLLFTPELLNGNDHKKALPSYFDLANIEFFKSASITFATQLLRRRTAAPIYFYTFDYTGAETVFGFDAGNAHYPFNGGVHHVDDLLYLFPTRKLNAEDTKIAKKMVEIWTSFAIKHEPCVAGVPKLLPMKTESGPYFHINTDITLGHDILQEFTATIDDPDNKKLDRPNISF